MKEYSKSYATLLLVAAATSLEAKSISPQNGDMPNVLFIAVDDLNDWSPCLGNYPNAKTPNIDRLAERGIIFTNAHCQAPISGPSRTSIMTGLKPSTTGVYLQIRDQIIKDANERTSQVRFLTEYFKDSGYTALGAGKIFHNGDGANTFEEYGGFYGGLKSNPMPPNGERMNFDWRYNSDYWRTMTDWGVIDGVEDEDMGDYLVAEFAVEALQRKHDKPFFIAAGFTRPHNPWHVPKKWFDMFPEEKMVTPPYKADDYNDIPEIAQQVNLMPQMPTTTWLIENNKWRSLIQSYLACMAFVDDQVGKVVRALEASPYADNTVIVLFSDHGYHFGEKNRTCKHSLWERSTHVPLIFAGKGIEPSLRCGEPVGLIDIYPTLIDLCGLDKNRDNEGLSLIKQIKNPKAKRKVGALTTFGMGNSSIIFDGYHYIEYEDGSQELYNLTSDPNEWNNVASAAESSKIIEQLRKQLPTHYEEYYPTFQSAASNQYFNDANKASAERKKRAAEAARAAKTANTDGKQGQQRQQINNN
ncbi:MAG: sulfatase [Rikenellaceae bacterium]